MRMNLNTQRGSVHGVHHMNLAGLASLGRPGLPSAFHVRRVSLGVLPSGLNRGLGDEGAGAIASQFNTTADVVQRFNILGMIPSNGIVVAVQSPVPAGYPLPPGSPDQNPADWSMLTYAVNGSVVGTAPMLTNSAISYFTNLTSQATPAVVAQLAATPPTTGIQIAPGTTVAQLAAQQGYTNYNTIPPGGSASSGGGGGTTTNPNAPAAATTPSMTSAGSASPSLVAPAGQGSQAPITIDLTQAPAAASGGVDLSSLFSGSTGTLLLVGGAAVLLLILASK